MKCIDLWKSRETETPSQILSNLSEQCVELGITQQDVYGDFQSSDSWLRQFEREVSHHIGKSDGLFVPSGVMAQQIALLVHYESSVEKNRTFVCHFSSHLLLHENDAHNKLINMNALQILPDANSRVQSPMTFESIQPYMNDPYSPCCLIVECPHRELGGKCTSYSDLRQMSDQCKRMGVAMHMDGARLWEAGAAYKRPLSEICALFDSVYVSFYKGLGALSGAMLCGDSAFIASARVWLRRFGGNLYTLMPYAVSCWSSYRANVSTFPGRLERLVQVITVVTSALSAHNFSHLIRFDPGVPEVSLIHGYIKSDIETAMGAQEDAVLERGIRCFNRLKTGKYGALDECYFEFNMGSHNSVLSDEDWITGWITFAQKLSARLAQI